MKGTHHERNPLNSSGALRVGAGSDGGACACRDGEGTRTVSTAIPLSPLGLPIDVVDDCGCTAYGFCGDEHRDAFFGQVEHEGGE